MYKFLFVFMIFGPTLWAEVSEDIRKDYAQKLMDAFTLQCEGKSTQAFFSFSNGFQEGTKAGESPIKLQVIADMFYWYRKYGSHLKLFNNKLTGNNVIQDEYKGDNCKSTHKHNFLWSHDDRYSEWGKDPKQAAQVRNFMLGVAQVISGVFIIYVTAPIAPLVNTHLGWGLVGTGSLTMMNSLHDMWTDHQMELYELQKITERVKAQ